MTNSQASVQYARGPEVGPIVVRKKESNWGSILGMSALLGGAAALTGLGLEYFDVFDTGKKDINGDGKIDSKDMGDKPLGFTSLDEWLFKHDQLPANAGANNDIFHNIQGWWNSDMNILVSDWGKQLDANPSIPNGGDPSVQPYEITQQKIEDALMANGGVVRVWDTHDYTEKYSGGSDEMKDQERDQIAVHSLSNKLAENWTAEYATYKDAHKEDITSKGEDSVFNEFFDHKVFEAKHYEGGFNQYIRDVNTGKSAADISIKSDSFTSEYFKHNADGDPLVDVAERALGTNVGKAENKLWIKPQDIHTDKPLTDQQKLYVASMWTDDYAKFMNEHARDLENATPEKIAALKTEFLQKENDSFAAITDVDKYVAETEAKYVVDENENGVYDLVGIMNRYDAKPADQIGIREVAPGLFGHISQTQKELITLDESYKFVDFVNAHAVQLSHGEVTLDDLKKQFIEQEKPIFDGLKDDKQIDAYVRNIDANKDGISDVVERVVGGSNLYGTSLSGNVVSAEANWVESGDIRALRNVKLSENEQYALDNYLQQRYLEFLNGQKDKLDYKVLDQKDTIALEKLNQKMESDYIKIAEKDMSTHTKDIHEFIKTIDTDGGGIPDAIEYASKERPFVGLKSDDLLTSSHLGKLFKSAGIDLKDNKEIDGVLSDINTRYKEYVSREYETFVNSPISSADVEGKFAAWFKTYVDDFGGWDQYVKSVGTT